MSGNIKKLTYSALFAAVIFLATAIFPITLPFGYVNMGDAFVLAAAAFLGPYFGAVSAGMGSALADLFLGFGIYAPATFVIKAFMAVSAGAVLRLLGRVHLPKIAKSVLVAFCAETVMVLGYFAYESCIYGVSGALASVLGNCLQGAFAVAAFTVTDRFFAGIFAYARKIMS